MDLNWKTELIYTGYHWISETRDTEAFATGYTDFWWHTNLSKEGYRPILPFGFASKDIPGSSSSLLEGMGPTGYSADGEVRPAWKTEKFTLEISARMVRIDPFALP